MSDFSPVRPGYSISDMARDAAAAHAPKEEGEEAAPEPQLEHHLRTSKINAKTGEVTTEVKIMRSGVPSETPTEDEKGELAKQVKKVGKAVGHVAMHAIGGAMEAIDSKK